MVGDRSQIEAGFFFSSRRRHTRYIGDWSSDVCSSDLPPRSRRCGPVEGRNRGDAERGEVLAVHRADRSGGGGRQLPVHRSEERRVGKEGRARWEPYHLKKKGKERRLWDTKSVANDGVA